MTTVSDPVAGGTDRPLVRTDLPLPDRREGKVRDIYGLPAEAGQPPRLLIVATDRISAFDVILPTPIPGKGRLLTDISLKWFELIRALGITGDHVVSGNAADAPGLDAGQRSEIAGRVVIARATEVVPIEFVVRGYLAGSGWREYQQRQAVCGVPLPGGLRNGDRLPEPIFTPTTKATSGHDEPLDFEQACAIGGQAVVRQLRDAALAIYAAGAEYALQRGIILADTKFEFGYALDDRGRRADELILIDEILTPDSSRYWPADSFAPGREQDNFDKQYVRNHLQGVVDAGQWDKTPPGPALPAEVVANTLSRYVEARDRLFGASAVAAG
ncbi:MAG: phosphoribosylaminoimidazolesuccinocarboxamide synthase [Planctomycetota bacterium]|jgi:phosphoribosylaminoimidazole-succinocarboxamide synthase